MSKHIQRGTNPVTMSTVAERMAVVWDCDWIALAAGDFDSDNFDLCIRCHPNVQDGGRQFRDKYDDAVAFLRTLLDRAPTDVVPAGVADVFRVIERLTRE